MFSEEMPFLPIRLGEWEAERIATDIMVCSDRKRDGENKEWEAHRWMDGGRSYDIARNRWVAIDQFLRRLQETFAVFRYKL